MPTMLDWLTTLHVSVRLPLRESNVPLYPLLQGLYCKSPESLRCCSPFFLPKGRNLLYLYMPHQTVHDVQDDLMMQLAEQQSLLPPFTLLDALRQHNVKLLCIAMFAAEGDNAPDGCCMADAALQWLGLTIPENKATAVQSLTLPSVVSQRQWLMPLSWKYVYGNTGSQGLY